MHIAAYCRVSSRSQNLETQRAAVRQAAAARGDGELVWYEESESGRSLKRPELDRLRSDVRAGKVSTVYAYRLDRLSRSGIRDTVGLLQELRAGGARVVTVADGFDPHGPFADLVGAVLSWAAEFERLAIGERIAAARRRVEAEGGAWGRPRMMGSDAIAQAERLLAAGKSLRAVAKELGVPRNNLARALGRTK